MIGSAGLTTKSSRRIKHGLEAVAFGPRDSPQSDRAQAEPILGDAARGLGQQARASISLANLKPRSL